MQRLIPARFVGRFGQLSSRSAVVSRGMTLVEIMVVVIIISMVTTMVGVTVFNRFEEARRKVTLSQIKSIGQALDLYRLSHNNYPSTAEGLQALVAPKGNTAPFLEKIPLDPWDHDYVYKSPGTRNPNGYDLYSYGPDGTESGDDIGSWMDKTS